MAEHTAGPWEAVYTPGEWIIRVAGKSGLGAYIAGSMIGGAERRANANLLAAAPEMLALAESVLVDGNLDSPQSMRMAIKSWRRRAEAAVAKAEGREAAPCS